jgi:hypothetical protein
MMNVKNFQMTTIVNDVNVDNDDIFVYHKIMVTDDR